MYSQYAIKIYAAKQLGIIKTRLEFWKFFNTTTAIDKLEIDTNPFEQQLGNANYNLICALDGNFPKISGNIKPSEKPFLFAYKGNISLLQNIENNISVVGMLTPTEDIINREKILVEYCVDNKFNIVSGLAKGCDAVAHSQCLTVGGKTIAILPTQLEHIYPAANKILADNITKHGGLLISEYLDKPKSKSEAILRFIERDRLQAMFASKIVLIASFAKGLGDSGSRHAMQKAKEYERSRYVLFNNDTDKNNPPFGLNKLLITDGAITLTKNSLDINSD